MPDVLRTDQRIFAIRRKGLYLTKAGAWISDIRRAVIYPHKQARRKAKIDVGMQCELVEVLPVEAPDRVPEIVE